MRRIRKMKRMERCEDEMVWRGCKDDESALTICSRLWWVSSFDHNRRCWIALESDQLGSFMVAGDCSQLDSPAVVRTSIVRAKVFGFTFFRSFSSQNFWRTLKNFTNPRIPNSFSIHSQYVPELPPRWKTLYLGSRYRKAITQFSTFSRVPFNYPPRFRNWL